MTHTPLNDYTFCDTRCYTVSGQNYNKWQKHIFTLAYEQKFALATFKQHLVSKHSIIGLFA